MCWKRTGSPPPAAEKAWLEEGAPTGVALPIRGCGIFPKDDDPVARNIEDIYDGTGGMSIT